MTSDRKDDFEDTTHCRVCGGVLGFEPRLGDYIMHEQCREVVIRYAVEAERRGAAAERARIRAILDHALVCAANDEHDCCSFHRVQRIREQVIGLEGEFEANGGDDE